jgi:two-component system cell cycle response regulator
VMGLLFSTAETVGIAAGVAVGASLLSFGTAFLVLRRLRRFRGSPEDRVSALVRELDLRMRQLGEDLSEELERTKEESRRSRYLGELAWTIELEEVMRRTLDAAAALDGVDAALVTALDETGEPMTKGAGLSEEELRQLALDQRAGSGRVQSLTISYVPVPGAASDDPPPVATSLQVPIEARNRTIGVVSVFSRDELRPFSEETQQALEDLAARAGPALDNARRYLEARRLADLDARTGLHNSRYFDETLAREVARARRYGRKLALVVFDLDDFKQINDRSKSHLVGNAALAGVAERLRDVVRSADIAARIGGDEFAVILTEATIGDAQEFYTRLREKVETTPVEPVGRITLSCGIAELEGQEDATTFFKRADDALYRAKEAGKGQVSLAASGVRLISEDVLRSAISEIEPAGNGTP